MEFSDGFLTLHVIMLQVANAGDSRCVICRAGRAVAMTVDHKPNDEAEHDRIRKAGHFKNMKRFRLKNSSCAAVCIAMMVDHKPTKEAEHDRSSRLAAELKSGLNGSILTIQSSELLMFSTLATAASSFEVSTWRLESVQSWAPAELCALRFIRRWAAL